jgi:hypothetical protein
MDQVTNGPNRGGGDTRTPSAKQEIARREEQIVALRLRHHSYSAIGRVVGVSKQNAQKAFLQALHRNTAVDIQTHHRSELAELDAQQAKLLLGMTLSPSLVMTGDASSPGIPRCYTNRRAKRSWGCQCPFGAWRQK